MERMCKKCLTEKDINCFQECNANKNYIPKTLRPRKEISRRSVCTKCMNDIFTKQYVQNNREHFMAKMKEYQFNIRENGSDSYYKKLLRISFGIKAKDVTFEMLNLIREAHGLQRELKENN